MGDKTGIEWTAATWNPLVGCEHVSPGCDHCYAAREASARLAHLPQYAGLARRGQFTGEVRLLPERLDQPLRWRKPRMIFANSMSDLFHKEVPDEFIAQVFAVMALADQHTFQVLTKRHARMRSLLNNGTWRMQVAVEMERLRPGALGGWPVDRPFLPLPNVWLGVSSEDQHWANIRIPALLNTPAAVRFVSAEPLLGPVDLHNVGGVDAIERDWCGGPGGGTGAPHPLLDWVIAGGESGPNARPMHPDWARSIRDQCSTAGIPFFMKQHGEWVGGTVTAGEHGDKFIPASMMPAGSDWWEWPGDDPRYTRITHEWPDGVYALRVGKRAAGHELDGQVWQQFPPVTEGVPA